MKEAKNYTGSYRELLKAVGSSIGTDDIKKLRKTVIEAVWAGGFSEVHNGVDSLEHTLLTSTLLCQMVSPDRNMVIAVVLTPIVESGHITIEEVEKEWGSDVASLVTGRLKVATLYGRAAAVDNDNFSRLLLAFTEDIRVIIIMIVDRQALMRAINHHPDEEFVKAIARESAYLYAPLAHRLGLYKIKSELEDLSMKYSNREIYTRIARGLNEKKAHRDAYIASFIAPIKKALEDIGLKFDIKGRTKSIASIWNKLRKQQIELKDVYDLFAIRIILDVEPEREKAECWKVYSIIADMYTPNPARLKDWLSIPKSNGYESLHTTVKGPEGKWVEVQIRSRRMDLVAEKGLAAHWRYKGVKSQGGIDTWMNNIRDILEAGQEGPMELMKDMKMDAYNKEVFVFTPKGDLFKLAEGATVLDMAFHIHSRLGSICTGARVNGRNRKINYRLQNGDTVEILTSSTQTPKQDWLNIVVTSKARTKIRQMLNERVKRAAEFGKEILQRRLKNRKIEMDEGVFMRLVKTMGYKTITEFYCDLGEERLDAGDVIARYETLEQKLAQAAKARSAEEFELMTPTNSESGPKEDVLVIGDNIKGLNYKLAKCCNPIYGDNVFGFVSAEGVIKIHRNDCPNARNIRDKYPYRIIKTRWSGKVGDQFAATLSVVGNDDIGIVTNISSMINKEGSATLRSISIDSHDGLFRGYLVVGVSDRRVLTNLIKKIKTVKGVKDVQRM